jgi:hypothetical protein
LVILKAFLANEEQSLDETKDVVRKKLGLGHDAAVELVQLRDGRRIDLEDGVSSPQSFTKKSQFALDDDFEAFKAVTKTSLHATVAVIIPNSSSTPVVCDHIPRRLILLTVQRSGRMPKWKGEEVLMALFLSRKPRTLAWSHLPQKALWSSYQVRVLLIHLVLGKSRRSSTS